MVRHSRQMLLTLAVLALAVPVARADSDFDDLQEQAIKAAVRKVAPCVVQIETSGGTDVIRTGPRGLIRHGTGPTTGLIVSADGYIISSTFNFANKPSAIRVSIPGHKERLVAQVVANDQTRMLTLLKVEATGLPVPVPAPRADIKIGYTSLALGRTLPATSTQLPSISQGIISAVERIWGKAIQTDAKVSPTNYGGPLIDLHGRVQGVLVPASPRAEGETAGFEWYDSGIGFAIPLDDVNRVLPRMKVGTKEKPVTLKRGLLGITMKGQDQHGTPPTIATVAPGSAAEKAGLKPNDTIKEVNGKPVFNQAQLLHKLGPKYEGDVVALKVLRGKAEITLDKVVLAGMASAFGQAFMGILPMRDDPELGVEVRFVYPKSPADKAGLKAGDRLLKIGRTAGPGIVVMQPFGGRDELLTLLEPAQPGLELKFEVKRKAGKTETVSVKLEQAPDTVPAELPEESSVKKALTKPKRPGPGPRPGPKPAPREEKKEGKKTETGLLKRKNAAGDRDYWVYVPINYDPNISHGIVVWLHPPKKNRERDIEDLTDSWAWKCEDYHLIMVIPKSDNERGWTQGESDFVQETIKTVRDAYTIDRRRIVAHGMDIGGEMAFYLGFHARSLIRGVATTGAALTSNPREKVANQSLSFFLVVGERDPLVKAVKESSRKLTEQKYPVIFREMPERGHEYLTRKTWEELVRWIDSLDRM